MRRRWEGEAASTFSGMALALVAHSHLDVGAISCEVPSSKMTIASGKRAAPSRVVNVPAKLGAARSVAR
jgi:hypothetical protein